METAAGVCTERGQFLRSSINTIWRTCIHDDDEDWERNGWNPCPYRKDVYANVEECGWRRLQEIWRKGQKQCIPLSIDQIDLLVSSEIPQLIYTNLDTRVVGQNANRTKCQPDIMPTKGWHFVRIFFCGWHFVRPNFLVGILSGPSQHVLAFFPNHENHTPNHIS